MPGYLCDERGRRYADNGALSHHRHSAHQERRWECAIYGYRFTRKDSLQTHQKVFQQILNIIPDYGLSQLIFTAHFGNIESIYSIFLD